VLGAVTWEICAHLLVVVSGFSTCKCTCKCLQAVPDVKLGVRQQLEMKLVCAVKDFNVFVNQGQAGR
jgi:hypothetical protein